LGHNFTAVGPADPKAQYLAFTHDTLSTDAENLQAMQDALIALGDTTDRDKHEARKFSADIFLHLGDPPLVPND